MLICFHLLRPAHFDEPNPPPRLHGCCPAMRGGVSCFGRLFGRVKSPQRFMDDRSRCISPISRGAAMTRHQIIAEYYVSFRKPTDKWSGYMVVFICRRAAGRAFLQFTLIRWLMTCFVHGATPRYDSASTAMLDFPLFPRDGTSSLSQRSISPTRKS